jgi:hypothetical protein
MNKILTFSAAILISSVAFSGCGPVAIGVDLAGNPNQEELSTLLYGVLLLAGVAAVVALVSAVNRD